MMATRNRPPLYERIERAVVATAKATGQGLALCALAATGYAYIWLADALINAPEPTERCFSTAARDMDYCRSQHDWGAIGEQR